MFKVVQKLFITLSILSILFLSYPMLTFGQPSSNSAALHKPIRVLLDDNYPPYTFRNEDGRLQGISVDRWALWEKKTGIPVQLLGMNWDDCQQQFGQGNGDVIDTMFMTSERTKIYEFSESYADIPVPIFFQKSIPGINDAESLAGFSVGVKKGDASVDYLHGHGITNIQEFDSYYSIIKAFQDQKIVVFIMDEPAALYYLYRMGLSDQIRYTAPLYTGQFHFAVRKGNTAMLDTISQGFEQISEKEYATINNRWIGSLFFMAKYLRLALWLLSIGAIVMLLLVFWNKTLHKSVHDKTKALEKTMGSLALSEAKYRDLVNNIRIGIVVYSPQSELLLYNQAYVDLLGEKYGDQSVFNNTRCGYNLLQEDGSLVLSEDYPVIKIIRTGQPIHDVIYGIRTHESKDITWVQINAFPEWDDASHLEQVVMSVVDISALKATEKLLYEASIHDPLTRLYNRSYFDAFTDNLERDQLQSCGLVMCDLDGLKLINDTMGHAYGDHYLMVTAAILNDCFRSNDIIARMGGDEFAVLMLNASENDIVTACEQLDKQIANYNATNNSIQLSISYSYSFRYPLRIDIDDMLKEADNYMYRVKLHRRQSIKSEIVQTVKTLLKVRDLDTDDHAERMQDLSCALAEAAGINENDIADVRLLAQFHDIGKVGIPDSILRKPGALDEDEKRQMRRHSEVGARIAETSADLMPIADWILKHHEWWNGQGYPLGLKGESIPIQCRIVSIIDAYDAMVNDRPYRAALDKKEAIRELQQNAGIQFDPDLVNKFIPIIQTASE